MMTIAERVSLIHKVNSLPYNAVIEICFDHEIASGTRYFKTIKLIDAAVKDESIRKSVDDAYAKNLLNIEKYMSQELITGYFPESVKFHPN